MPVRKFRDMSETGDTLWYERTDPMLPRAVAQVWDFAGHACPLQFTWVHRYVRSKRRTLNESAGRTQTSGCFRNADVRGLWWRSSRRRS